jgi:hypothetical protein
MRMHSRAMLAMAAELSADAGQLCCGFQSRSRPGLGAGKYQAVRWTWSVPLTAHSLDAGKISKDLFGIQAVEIV